MVIPKPPETKTTIFNVPIEKPKPPEPKIATPETIKLPPATAIAPPIPIPTQNNVAESNDFPIASDPIILAGSLSGTADIPDIVKPTLDPIAVPEPIFIKAKRDPKYAGRFQPDYPGRLLRQEVEGKVRLRFLIGSNGRVKSVKILSSSHPLFASAAEKQALKQWRFIPATRDGITVEEWQTITVSFNLNG